MNDTIKKIITRSDLSNERKLKQLDSLLEDIHTAKDILSGKLTYCKYCDDYYLARSFHEEQETIPCEICVYKDYINSGGNEYVDGYADVIYRICPKGHKYEINREERCKGKED